MTQSPSPARLIRAWAILMALTVTGMLSGQASGVAVIAIAGFKARFVLMDYLNLRRAGGVWQGLLTVYLVIVGGAILAAYAVGMPRG